MFCETLLDVLDRIPGDARTQIGFIAYDSSIHYFNLAEGLSQPQMLTVSDVDGTISNTRYSTLQCIPLNCLPVKYILRPFHKKLMNKSISFKSPLL